MLSVYEIKAVNKQRVSGDTLKRKRMSPLLIIHYKRGVARGQA